MSAREVAAISNNDLERLERERQDADRRYNEALTAFDAALIHLSPADATLAADTAPPPLPGGLPGRALRIVQRWLMPWLDRQHAFNVRTTAAVEAIAARERERAAALDRFQSALVGFLQGITAFVETKDRQLAANATARSEAQQAALGGLPDLQAQVAVLQRATHMLTRRAEESAAHKPGTVAVASAGAAAAHAEPIDDYKYVAFEDQFRGSVEDVRSKLADYVPIFHGASNVLDIGCGRGEFLALLEGAGVSAQGVDVNADMAAAARERGLTAVANDALAHLSSLADESLGGLFAAQVVEHLEPSYLIRLLEVAFHKLRPGAPIVLETINAACWVAFFSSYLRDLTHVRPIHPETLEFLTRASGFERVSIRYSAPVAEHTRMKSVDVPQDILDSSEASARAIVEAARAININSAILNKLAFSYHDYAVIGYRS